MQWLGQQTVQQLNATIDDVLVLNSRSQGFYRVQYEPEELQRIRQLLLDEHQVEI